jgi:hypothetical protein
LTRAADFIRNEPRSIKLSWSQLYTEMRR